VRIVVLVKQVPNGINDVDACAVGLALRLAPWRRDVRVTALTMGPSGAVGSLRAALALGAGDGVHVLDGRLSGSDALATSRTLAAAVARIGFDLVLCGCAAAGPGMSAVPPMIAERLGVAGLCGADAAHVREDRVEVRRLDGAGVETFAADLPAVVSVTTRCGWPRYPRLTATFAARHKPIRTWSLDDLGIDREDGVPAPGVDADPGADPGRSATAARAVCRQRGGGSPDVVTEDPCMVAVRVADFLAERRFL
jgi:electron transfer flavoprotein beta subunit